MSEHSHSHQHQHHHDGDDGGSSHVHSHADIEHGHTHDHLEDAGEYNKRELIITQGRNIAERAFTVGIGGPVGSGKTALMLALCRSLRDEYSIAAITNDIFTKEDAEFLTKNNALPADRIKAIETGGCPHAAIREDISANLLACETFTAQHDADIIFLESGGDNLAANYSRELADYIIFVIDVAGGDKVPRKGGPGITQSDLFVINKTDLASLVGADLEVMKRDSIVMRGDGPTIFTQITKDVGVEEIKRLVVEAYQDFKSAISQQLDTHTHEQCSNGDDNSGLTQPSKKSKTEEHG